MYAGSVVLEHRPAQQGLRQREMVIVTQLQPRTRASSSTTRIETCIANIVFSKYSVLEHRPAQQGLRPRIPNSSALAITGTRASSSTTRIKPDLQTLRLVSHL